jgi:O-succinylbenzoic acid--CoA ligase
VQRLLDDWLATADAPPLIVRTSGSTGEPKDVLLSAAALRASAAATAARLGGDGQWLLALPVHYVAGLQVVIRSRLAGAEPVVLAEHADLASAVRSMTHARRYLSLVPTQLHRALADPAQTEALASLDAVLLGGSAARSDLIDRCWSVGITVVTTYGMSETCGGCVYDGWPLDGVSVRLDADGRVEISGPVLFDGYAGEPQRTAEVLRDGWLRTPDIGHHDDGGRLVIDGRADDVAISGGLNIPLGAVERRLAEHPSIEEAAVVALPDPEWGASLVAIVVIRPGASISLEEVRDFVGDAQPRTWAPRRLLPVESLPMLESGKLDRLRLRALLAGAWHG